jgi:bisanhydrobacterioruberin hydratase
MLYLKKYNPLYFALLFHITGVLGILFTPYKDWFVYSTPLVLLTMFVLLTKTQIKFTKDYILFFLIAFVIGMATEIVGVNTGLLFGDYQYGQVFGPKTFGVPILIGLNWFVIVFCSGALCTQGIDLLQNKLNIKITGFASSFFVIIGGATIATCFDFILEPVAIKLQFWSWNNGHIPLFNYICWFSISAILLGIKTYLKKITVNTFATSLIIIQAVFFLILNLFL